MKASFERHISDSLRQHSQIDLAVDQLLRLWKDRGCSSEDTNILFRFLIVSGYELTLCSQLQFLTDKKLEIPWLYILDLFFNHKSSVEFSVNDFLNNLFTAANEKTLRHILKYNKYDSLDPRFDTIRSEWIGKELEGKHGRKKEILTKLQMLKHERMLEEERKLFTAALEEFPTDDELLSKYTDFQRRYADNIFQKTETKRDSLWIKLFKKESSPKDNPYVIQMLKLAKKYPAETYWIASSLYLSECYTACIELLDKKQKTYEEKWLLLEAYIQDRQFLIALEYARQLENELKGQPDHLMSCLYQQAICLEKLGKRSEAIQILTSILNHNKNFKMAQYLFDEWSKA